MPKEHPIFAHQEIQNRHGKTSDKAGTHVTMYDLAIEGKETTPRGKQKTKTGRNPSTLGSASASQPRASRLLQRCEPAYFYTYKYKRDSTHAKLDRRHSRWAARKEEEVVRVSAMIRHLCWKDVRNALKIVRYVVGRKILSSFQVP